MVFTAKILSWRFRHLNIVGCLLKRRPTKGGSRAPQDLPLATPLQLYMPAQEEPLTNVLELMGTTKRTFQTVKVMFITHETILKDDF